MTKTNPNEGSVMPTTVWGVVEGGRVVPSSALPEGARVEITLANQPDVPQELRAEFEAWDRASDDALNLVETPEGQGEPTRTWDELYGLGREVWSGDVPSSAMPEGAPVETTIADGLSNIPTLERPAPISVQLAISTFAPEPFEVIKPFNIVIQSDDGGYTASWIEANIGSAGDTQHEAMENLKDLILMIFEDFEGDEDDALGPAMLKQKTILLDLIRRKS
jgi:predicted RNase H-like HicB family nuclease